MKASPIWTFEEAQNRHGYYLIADKAYAYRPWLLTPYKVKIVEYWTVIGLKYSGHKAHATREGLQQGAFQWADDRGACYEAT